MSLIRRIRPQKTGIRAPLGDLELAVMRHVWRCGDAGCLATDVLEALSVERPVALTTVLTTLDRLYDKGILRRERIGKAYRYGAALSEDHLQQRIVEGVLGDLIAQFPNAVAAYFTQQGLPDPAGPSAPADAERLSDLARRLTAIVERQPSEAAETMETERDGV